MYEVRAKKHLGQHFLKDENIARNIVESLTMPCNAVLEIGPGTGVLTKYLIKLPIGKFIAMDVDRDSIPFLKNTFPEAAESFIEGDFLRMPIDEMMPGNFSIIGNFPYNISSQIFFKVLENRNRIPEVVGNGIAIPILVNWKTTGLDFMTIILLIGTRLPLMRLII